LSLIYKHFRDSGFNYSNPHISSVTFCFKNHSKERMPFNVRYINTSEAIKADVEAFLRAWNDSNDHVTVHTSGSTGKPNQLSIKKRDMIISAKRTLDFLSIPKGSVATLCLSPSTIGGKMMIVRAIVGEMTLLVGQVTSLPLSNNEETSDLIAMVPLQLSETLISSPEKLFNHRNILIGGGPVSNSTIELLKKNRLTVWHTYGMTETISHVAMRRIGLEQEESFHALPGIDFTTNDGKLVIHYPAIGIQELQTNDLVELISPTSFNYIGRADFIINSGGIKFNPEELEDIIHSQIPVAFFIAGIKDEKLGEKLILVLESPTPFNISVDELKSLLPKHAVPKELFFVKEFIRTASGKIDRVQSLKLIL
jgi:O-succinylbenzoic acid--CoA ligase